MGPSHILLLLLLLLLLVLLLLLLLMLPSRCFIHGCLEDMLLFAVALQKNEEALCLPPKKGGDYPFYWR